MQTIDKRIAFEYYIVRKLTKGRFSPERTVPIG